MRVSIKGTSRRVELVHEVWPIEGVFRLSRGARVEVDVVVATIGEGGLVGRGEAVPYGRYGETVEGVLEAAGDAARGLADGMSRAELQSALGPGAARNALDCALWDLEARLLRCPVWQLAGLAPPAPLPTAFTIGLGTPEVMEAKARTYSAKPLLKIKLGGGEGDMARVGAVRRGAPGSRLIVDANEGWSVADYLALAPRLAEQGVSLIEQPLPAGDDAILSEAPRPVPVCADESCHDRASLPALVGRYDLINIKLDKTGGLTEAIALRAAARAAGFGLMVGCMVSTSLAVAPATLLAGEADFVDLDGAWLLAHDRQGGLVYDDGTVAPARPGFWGEPR